MASTYHTIGNIRYRRAVKQGAPKKPNELKRNRRVMIYTTKQAEQRFIEMQNRCNMSKSAFGDMVLFYGLEAISKLFDSNNCSKS
jgi:hypothetical protein